MSRRPRQTVRAPHLERPWLEQAVVLADRITAVASSSYVDHVEARLGEHHGPLVVPGRGPARLLRDLHGLAVDLGALSVLGAQHPQAHVLEPTLLEVAALGAAAAHLASRQAPK